MSRPAPQFFLLLTLLLALLCCSPTVHARETRPGAPPTCAFFRFGGFPSQKIDPQLQEEAGRCVEREFLRNGLGRSTQQSALRLPKSTPPWATTLDPDLQRIAWRLGVDRIAVTGITNIKISRKPFQAKVTLFVNVFDVVAGTLYTGAIESGFSTLSHPNDRRTTEDHVREAMHDAIRSCVQVAVKYSPPTAQVVSLSRNRINLRTERSDTSLAQGMIMIVVRGRRRIARIRVHDINSPTKLAGAKLLRGNGLLPGDRAYPDFTPPCCYGSCN